MSSLNCNLAWLALISSLLVLTYQNGTSVSGAIAGSRDGGNTIQQDKPSEAGGYAVREMEGEGQETTTVDPDTIKGTDRFVIGFNALVKAVEVFFQKIDKKVEKKVMALEDFLNLIHNQVHINGTEEDFHETAYITMRVE